MVKVKKTPEEIAALKAKYGDKSAEKAAAKAAKQAKFGDKNADQNTPICEIIVPWSFSKEDSNGPIAGKDIDLDLPHWQHYLDRCEDNWRQDFAITQSGYDPEKIYRGPCKRRIIRT